MQVKRGYTETPGVGHFQLNCFNNMQKPFVFALNLRFGPDQAALDALLRSGLVDCLTTVNSVSRMRP